jgi:hypothetical protein
MDKAEKLEAEVEQLEAQPTAAQERAAVVAWLIERYNNTSYLDVIRMVIKQFSRSIEQGEHWPTEESNELG